MMEDFLGKRSPESKFSHKNHALFSFQQKSESKGNGLFDSNQLSQKFLRREQTALLVILATNQVSQKTFQYILKTNIKCLWTLAGFFLGGGGGCVNPLKRKMENNR